MRHAVVWSASALLAGCFHGRIESIAVDAEPLDKKVSTYVVQGDEYKIVERDRPGTDELALVAIQRRDLTRMELRALARHLAGQARRPAIALLASTETYAACLRSGSDPGTNEACERGKVLSVESPGPRVLRWGTAAPRY